MKKSVILTLISIFILNLNLAKAQEIELGNNFYFKSFLGSKISKEKLKLNKDDNLPEGAEIKSKAQIKVVNIEDERVYFKYLNYDNGSLEESIYNYDSNNIEKIFSLSKSDFEKLTNTYYNYFRGFKYGGYTVPIRLRSSRGNFEFDANLSLGANIVGRLGSRFNENMYVDLSFGVGLTKINLNKENSILGTENSDFADIDVLSPTAITVSFGALFNLAKNVNMGAYWGWDRISSADNKSNWIFNKKPWLGIGLNVSFSGDAENSNAKK